MEEKNLLPFFEIHNGECWLAEDDRDNLKISYRLKEVISSKQSPYQHVDIVNSYDFGKCLVLDGVMQTNVLDGFIYNEMISHIPIVTYGGAQDVLIIGGGDCGVVNEAAKYKELRNIDMVEVDKAVTEECRKHMPEVAGFGQLDNRINLMFTDGIKYVKKANKKYDIVIVDSSDPVGPAIKLFEKEFYNDIENILNDDGLMVCQSESPLLYKDILKNVRSLLKGIFPIVRTYIAVIPSYPGGIWSFTLASKKYDPLKADVSKLVKNTKYINEDVFRASFKLPNFIKEFE